MLMKRYDFATCSITKVVSGPQNTLFPSVFSKYVMIIIDYIKCYNYLHYQLSLDYLFLQQ
jgi:hypothetical protein